ncbi:hypothetical protein BT93_L3228 [Corymbia citriodora subsp. variegata]|uniref:Uncharacterized protein n=1 Tax=Corymbia citriodora subsp. variegata TaxID=360336 RepID=A0A8T0CHQ9_CORYI|nr:hypothetical protein BT93_L3228 [Corymbia citriodora subsp. variegata]
MGDDVRVPYPPCAYKPNCKAAECCYLGILPNPFRWPQLVGQSGWQAKAVIEKDNPYVTVIFTVVKQEQTDFCCNRVYVWVDLFGSVLEIPTVG